MKDWMHKHILGCFTFIVGVFIVVALLVRPL